MTRDQAEQQAKEWLWENIGPCDKDSALHRSLATLLLATQADALEEAAQWVLGYNCEHNHGPKATTACDDIETRLREQAQVRRQA